MCVCVCVCEQVSALQLWPCECKCREKQREMDREILMASFQKIRELALYLDSARWRQPRGLGVWAIDALQCDSNQSDEGAGVGRDEQRVAWQNKASQSDSCTIIYSSSLTLTHDQPLIGIHNSLPNEDVNFATVAASQDAL